MIVLQLLAVTLVAVTLPGTFELLMLTFGWLVPKRAIRGPHAEPVKRLAVVIPAHDEEEGIAATVTGLLNCDLPADTSVELFIIADNCTDSTAALARTAGEAAGNGFEVSVFERHDTERRGKGFALFDTFEQLLARTDARRPDALMVVDADTKVEANFLTATTQAFSDGAEAIQVPYHSGDPESSMRARLQHLALLCFNHLRPKSRESVGLSVGILGNGFGLRAALLERVPYTASSIVEDLEYHIQLCRTGTRVRFVEATTVAADAPPSAAGAATQRSRWEGGRFRMIKEHAPSLAKEVVGGRPRLLEPLLELLLLPLAFHVLLIVATLCIPFVPTQLYALFALGLVAVHVLAGIAACGGGVKDLGALAVAPLYVGWKLLMLPKLFATAARNASWSRTERS